MSLSPLQVMGGVMNRAVTTLFSLGILALGASAQAPPAKSETKPDWANLIPSIRVALKETFPQVRIEETYKIGIVQVADITGDRIPEALISLGVVGAYTDYVTLVQMAGGKPVVARFKQKDGKVAPSIFLQGASVRHSQAVKMLPEKHAIYSAASRTDDDMRIRSCSAAAYQWNAATRTFDWSKTLSKQITESYCRALRAQTAPRQ